MPAYQHRIRVLKAFADAYWLDGADQTAKDSALKSTTSVLWDNKYLTTDELAVMVIVPDAWLDDSDIAWEEIRQELRRAFAKKIDQAVFFGQGSVPSTFTATGGIYAASVASGNVVNSNQITGTQSTSDLLNPTGSSTYTDYGDAIAALAEQMALDGYDPNGVVTGPAFKWVLARLRDKNNVPLLDRDFAGPTGQSIYGLNLGEVANGAWDNTRAQAIMGDFNNLVMGIRQDITFSVSDSATLLGTDVASSYSAFQSDGKVLRAVMRVGFAVPDPVHVLGGTYPFGVLRSANGASS